VATVTHTIVVQCVDAAEYAAFVSHITQQQQQEADLTGSTRDDDENALSITITKATEVVL
jgi:hypothetical protein